MYLYKHYMDEKIIYVGITLDIAKRSLQHKKQSMWFKNVTYIEYVKFESESELRKAELEEIRKYEPINNMAGNPRKVSWFKRHKGFSVETLEVYKVVLEDNNGGLVYGATFFDKAQAARIADELRCSIFGDDSYLNKQIGIY